MQPFYRKAKWNVFLSNKFYSVFFELKTSVSFAEDMVPQGIIMVLIYVVLVAYPG